MGLLPEDMGDGFLADPSEVEVWPDLWASALAFEAMGTQWRMGPSGPTGLDYAALHPVFRLQRIPRCDWDETFDDVRVLERAALVAMREGQE